MPEFQQLVRERLGALGISPALEDEVIAELADHLEDVRATALRSGKSEVEAMDLALEQVPNWLALAREISAAKKEGPMNERTKILWLPGMTMLIASAILQLLILRMIPPAAWFHPRAPILFFIPWFLSYALFGALGACWSRRNGGNKAMRFLSGIFPVMLHLAIFICVIVAAWMSTASRFPEHHQFTALVRLGIGFIVLPGAAFALGALPLLHNHASSGPMTPAGNR